MADDERAAVDERASDERCPACGGERAILGVLGTWRWLRCRACGIDSTSGAPSRSAFRRRVAQARSVTRI